MFKKNLLNRTLGTIMTVLTLVIGPHSAVASQPTNSYKDCLQEKMTGKSDDIAQHEAETICHKQFPQKIPQDTALPKTVMQKLKIDAGFGWGIFSGSIYNGNSDYYVTQLIVRMKAIHDDHHTTMSHEAKTHQIMLNLPPLSKGALSMPLTGDDSHVHDFEWEIIKVIGYRADANNSPQQQ